MSSAAYKDWVKAGKPYRLARPVATLQARLHAHGLTVYDYPDDSHLLAATPEDHTPFSATGWPGSSTFGVAHAIDVMPRSDTAAGRRENATIARRLIADRNAGVAGVAWIKYLNWTDEGGVCRQERWMPNHETRSSTDKGHLHISGRADCDNDDRATGYDPLDTEGSSMAEIYGLAGDPGDGRTTPTRVVDLWIGEQEATAKGYGSPTARTARLMRIEAAVMEVQRLLREQAAELDDVKTAQALGGITPEALDDALDRALVRLGTRIAA
jgi:hypothetical protein